MGMIQAETGENQMPHENKAREQEVVFDFEPHMQKFIKCDGVVLQVHHGCCQHKHRNHDEQIE
jgi:hypothetical protein